MLPSLKFTLLLTLIVCGPVWGVPPPGTKPDCNSNLLVREIQPLAFGSFSVGTSGSVTIDAVPPNLRSATGVSLVGNDGQPGIIEVSMPPGYGADCTKWPLLITLPASYLLTSSAAQTITVTALSSSPASGVVSLAPGNAPVLIYLGATATVTAGQPGGLYNGSYLINVTF